MGLKTIIIRTRARKCGGTTIERTMDPRDEPEDDGLVMPMYEVEAQKLINISLEGSVG